MTNIESMFKLIDLCNFECKAGGHLVTNITYQKLRVQVKLIEDTLADINRALTTKERDTSEHNLDATEFYLEEAAGSSCPWCKSQPTIMPWHGGGTNQHRIGCVNDECKSNPSVVGETRQEALINWNTRTIN